MYLKLYFIVSTARGRFARGRFKVVFVDNVFFEIVQIDYQA